MRYFALPLCDFDAGDCCCDSECHETKEIYLKSFLQNVDLDVCGSLMLVNSNVRWNIANPALFAPWENVYDEGSGNYSEWTMIDEFWNNQYYTEEALCSCLELVTEEHTRCVSHWINMFIKDRKKQCGFQVF